MAAQRFTPDVIARAEELVSKIQGISSCRIATDETGEITEVHVVASPYKTAKLIARDVESCLKAELGIDVDYKKIGVVILDHGGSRPTEAPRPEKEEPVVELPLQELPQRFAFQSVNLFLSQEGVKAEVELTRAGAEAFGSSSSTNPAQSPLELVAQATLNALMEFLDQDLRLCLFEVREVPLGTEKAIVVRVGLVRGRDVRSLVGSTIVAGDVNRAVVFATLDAVNRVLERLKTRGSFEYFIG